MCKDIYKTEEDVTSSPLSSFKRTGDENTGFEKEVLLEQTKKRGPHLKENGLDRHQDAAVKHETRLHKSLNQNIRVRNTIGPLIP